MLYLRIVKSHTYLTHVTSDFNRKNHSEQEHAHILPFPLHVPTQTNDAIASKTFLQRQYH